MREQLLSVRADGSHRAGFSGHARTLFDKIWDSHVIVHRGENEALLRVDRQLVTDGSFHAFAALEVNGRKVRKRSRRLRVADHYVPTRGREGGFREFRTPRFGYVPRVVR